MRRVLLWCAAVGLPVVVTACGAGRDAHSTAPQTAQFPEPQSAGAVLLRRYCSTCHGAPQPRAHTAAQWPNVVARMEQHRVMRGLDPISQDDLGRLIDYLQRNAGEVSHTDDAAP